VLYIARNAINARYYYIASNEILSFSPTLDTRLHALRTRLSQKFVRSIHSLVVIKCYVNISLM